MTGEFVLKLRILNSQSVMVSSNSVLIELFTRIPLKRIVDDVSLAWNLVSEVSQSNQNVCRFVFVHDVMDVTQFEK